MDSLDRTTEIELLKKQLAKAQEEIRDLKMRLENVMILLKQEMSLPKNGR
jgi:hypothetical protein